PNAGSGKKKLTVVVVAYNESDILIRLLDKLSGIKTNHTSILLVDNGLDGKTKKKLKKYPMHYLCTREDLGCSAGRNLGASQVTTEFVAFLDADAMVDDDYLQVCFDAMTDKNTICARGRVLSLSNGSYL